MDATQNTHQSLSLDQILGNSCLPESIKEKSQLKFNAEKGGFDSDFYKSTGCLSSFAANMGLSFVARFFKPNTRKQFKEANKQLVDQIGKRFNAKIANAFEAKFSSRSYWGSPLTVGSVRAFFKNIIVTSQADLPKHFNLMLLEDQKIYSPDLNNDIKDLLKKDFGDDVAEKFSENVLSKCNEDNLLTGQMMIEWFEPKKIIIFSKNDKNDLNNYILKKLNELKDDYSNNNFSDACKTDIPRMKLDIEELSQKKEVNNSETFITLVDKDNPKRANQLSYILHQGIAAIFWGMTRGEESSDHNYKLPFNLPLDTKGDFVSPKNLTQPSQLFFSLKKEGTNKIVIHYKHQIYPLAFRPTDSSHMIPLKGISSIEYSYNITCIFDEKNDDLIIDKLDVNFNKYDVTVGKNGMDHSDLN